MNAEDFYNTSGNELESYVVSITVSYTKQRGVQYGPVTATTRRRCAQYLNLKVNQFAVRVVFALWYSLSVERGEDGRYERAHHNQGAMKVLYLCVSRLFR